VNAHRCCVVSSGGVEQKKAGVRIAGGDPHRPSFTRRSLDLTAKMVPVAILAVLPKCPACVAAYVALGTGIGFSLTAATYLRLSLVVLCVASLVYFTARSLRPRLEQFRNYCGLIKIARCGFLWEKTTKMHIASVYTNCETAVGGMRILK
jgi:hypothetical protein